MAAYSESTPASLGTLQPTDNRTGFDFRVPTFRWEAWANAYEDRHPLLDVGSGLGTNSLEALVRKRARVVAMDPSANHLEKLRESAAQAGVTQEMLTTVQGELPDLPREVTEAAPFSGVLCAQVLHFLKASLVDPSFHALAKVLAPGGRLVLTCASLYQLPQESGLIEKMEQELFGPQLPPPTKEEEEHHHPHGAAAFPGWVLDTTPLKRMWARGHGDEAADRVAREAMPDSLHVFHPCQLKYQAEQAGLVMEECDFVAGARCGMPKEFANEGGQPGAGKENVYLVARKPTGLK